MVPSLGSSFLGLLALGGDWRSLTGIKSQWMVSPDSDRQMLEFASAAAACNLLEANAVDGMKERNEILRLAETYGRLPM